ncbi:MAG: aspartate-semialdehyde dehydrogenase, partial [Planctomycetota bacterium]|nr:aspartate-semialdehyde dehydrogenase [Planctomycetota bacterium]
MNPPMPPSGRIPVSVLGATGSVGQRFVALLADHPWFELAALAASVRSEGRSYGEAVRWILPTPLPDEIARMPVASPDPDLDGRIAFSALPAEVAGPVERALAEAGRLVVTNTSVHRMEPSVPLLVPEVNPEHLDLLGSQNFGRGGIIANPNCSTIGLCLALKPIHDAFGVRSARVVTLQ